MAPESKNLSRPSMENLTCLGAWTPDLSAPLGSSKAQEPSPEAGRVRRGFPHPASIVHRLSTARPNNAVQGIHQGLHRRVSWA